jgi:predicted nucleic acid-binding protein
VIVIDANLLLYAYNADAPEHARAVQRLEGVLTGSEIIGLPWTTIWAFFRVTTNPRL